MTGDSPVLRLETSSLGTVVEQEQVARLPLNGRTFITLASLAPGVALPPNSQLPRINGGRPRTNEYLFDGISVLQPEPGQVAFFPVIDAIQEFKIESNSPPAEFGRFNGGVVNLTTRSGTNAVHGSGLRVPAQRSAERAERLSGGQHREAGLQAEPVRRHLRRTAGPGSHVLLRRLPGAAPVDRPHGDLRRCRQSCSGRASSPRRSPGASRSFTIRRPRSASTRTPFPGQHHSVGTASTRSRCRCCSAIRCRPSTGTANNYRRTENEIDDQDQWDARVDHRFSTRDQLFGRLSYFRDGFVPVTPLPEGSGVTTGTLGPQDTTAWAFASSYQHTFSASDAERAAHRRHAAQGGANRRAARRRRPATR